jgi:hypothetical protein
MRIDKVSMKDNLESIPVKLSPSDLTFLWDECKRCFYLKYKHNFRRPFGGMPGIFGTIDKLMKDFYMGRKTASIANELPPGVVKYGEKWVQSKVINRPDRETSCYIRGKFDTVIAFEDGSYGVIDFKTSQPKPYHIPFYSRQLHAYSYALEHADEGKFALNPISMLGLLVVTPYAMEVTPAEDIAYIGRATWMPVPLDESLFLAFIDQVLELLDRSELPEPGAKCPYCSYRTGAHNYGF